MFQYSPELIQLCCEEFSWNMYSTTSTPNRIKRLTIKPKMPDVHPAKLDVTYLFPRDLKHLDGKIDSNDRTARPR